MVRPIRALAARGEEMGNRSGPQLTQLKAAGAPRPLWPLLMTSQAVPALARPRGLWQGSARLVEAFWPILVSGARCRSSVVEHSIGNGEVDSSILSGSTSLSLEKAL
jgi:hypothetical protein